MARRIFQERHNYIHEMTDMQLIQRYRLDRETLEYLEQELHAVLSPATARNHSLSAMTKILITLRYLASGHIQLNDSDIHSVSQPTASRAITDVLKALADPRFVGRFIQFPRDQATTQRNKEDFFHMANFPNVVGLIDGTHIQIKAPSRHEPAYVNRMGYHSINTQIVFDSQDLIIDLVARWPGSVHDSRILRQSGLCAFMEADPFGAGNHYLLGDSGYPCKRWLLTPYLNPQEGSQQAYNRAHKKTRSKVERGIGQLKVRWNILHGEIRLAPLKVCQVILACGVLHNLCKVRRIPLPEAPVRQNNDENDQEQVQAPANPYGLRYRDMVANNFF